MNLACGDGFYCMMPIIYGDFEFVALWQLNIIETHHIYEENHKSEIFKNYCVQWPENLQFLVETRGSYTYLLGLPHSPSNGPLEPSSWLELRGDATASSPCAPWAMGRAGAPHMARRELFPLPELANGCCAWCEWFVFIDVDKSKSTFKAKILRPR